MSFKTIKLPFTVPAAEEPFYTEIRKEVNAYFADKSRYADHRVLIKAVVYAILVTVTYAGLLQADAWWQLQLFYWCFGFTSFLFALNFAHDAAHHSLTGKKQWDNLIYEVLFNFQGANGYLWRIRHNHSHHAYPNVDDCDADLQVNGLIALSPNQPLKWYHQYQHIYAPFAYIFYTLLWIFYKDIVLFTKKRQANIVFQRHAVSQWIKFVLYKAGYIGIFVVIPYKVTGMPLHLVLLAFVLMHFLLSLFLLFTFLISHYVEGIVFTNPEEEPFLRISWARHQVNVSVDFHAESPWAACVFGGFNAHVAHHLFPQVCHIHYPAITRIIKRKLKAHNVHYRSVTFLGGIVSHLRFIKQQGKSEVMPSLI